MPILDAHPIHRIVHPEAAPLTVRPYFSIDGRINQST